MKRVRLLLWCGMLAVVPAALSQVREYAIILQDPPVARQIQSRHELRSSRAREADSRIEQAQARIRQQLAARNVRVITSTKTLLNAVFVSAGPDEAAALRSLPGVVRVAPLREAKLHLNKALPLIKAPEAWAVLAGAGLSDPGAGVKIAIIDTGIDQTHPGFQDPSLPMPSGYPLCAGADCGYTNNKVIVVRSYVWMTAQGSGVSGSRPDDLSARDRVGHGTAAAMIAAGVQNDGPLGAISGVAPKAYLGSYKVFGSPYINDGASPSAIIKALEDAFNDGMDIASLSLGFPAWFGPLDKGSACGSTDPNAICEVEADTVETAVSRGMIVTVSAGNDGDAGVYVPTLSTIHTPGIAPSAITVGASRNAHDFYSTVSVAGQGAPPTVTNLAGLFGGGPLPDTALTAPLRDVNGLACSALAPNTMSGAIALVQRGNCYFSDKVRNAEAAGAVGVIVYCEDSQYCAGGGERPFPPGGLAGTSIPAMLIGTSSGRALKSWVQSHPDAQVTMDPTVTEYADPDVDTLASFSSRGPSIAPETAIKPEVVGIGTSVYMAAQDYDPNGEMYSSSRYTIADGTSFSAPMAAGIAALLKQKNPNFTPAQIKSAIVNTASRTVTDAGVEARVTAVGAGKLDASAAVQSNVFLDPPTLSFGSVTAALMGSTKRLTVTNDSSNAVTLAVVPRDSDPNARLTLSSGTVAANSTKTISVTLQGSVPSAGSYEGAITVTGGAVDLRVPYFYATGTGVVDNLFPVSNTSIEGTVGQPIPGWVTAIRAVDQYGIAVEGTPVDWTVSGGTQIGFTNCSGADTQTYARGLAAACVQAGPSPIPQTVTATAGGLQMSFSVYPRVKPVVDTNSSGQLGVTNGASFNLTNNGKPALSPGSYITIFGSNLADDGVSAEFDRYLPPAFVYLPLAIQGVSVSFDVPGISAPGHLRYVSPGQVNVQVPFELQGQSTASMKIRVGDTVSNVYTIQLADAAPGIFENDPYTTGQLWAAAQHADTFAPVAPSKPAQKSEWLLIYATGLGPVYNQPASGEPAPFEPLAGAKLPPTVTIGGKPVKSIYYSGLTPSYMGLYQVNVQVADDTPSGRQPVVITVNGDSSKAAYVSVQ